MPDKENKLLPFGCTAATIAPKVIMTPFLSLQKLAKQFQSIEASFEGLFFFKGFTGVLQGQRITVLYVQPSGNLAGDAVLFLQNTPCREIIFAGSYGSLRGLAIGTVAYVQNIYRASSFYDYLNSAKLSPQKIEIPEVPEAWRNKLRGISLLSVNSLYSELDLPQLKELLAQGIEGLDMEAAAFFAALKFTEKQGCALLFNADQPLEYSIFSNPQLSRQGRKLTDNYIAQLLELACLPSR